MKSVLMNFKGQKMAKKSLGKCGILHFLKIGKNSGEDSRMPHIHIIQLLPAILLVINFHLENCIFEKNTKNA